MRILVVLSLFAVTLAGCNGNGGGQDPDVDFSDLGLEATPTTGVIRGVVVDLAIVPIAGAVIQIKSVGANTTTTEDGRFGFDGLEAGTYFLDISRMGYGSVQQSVDVVAGEAEPEMVKVLLQSDGTLRGPFVEQFVYQGFISCSYKLANIVFDAGGCDPTGHTGYAARDDASHFVDIGMIPDFFQSEIVWDSTQPAGDELVTIQLACEDGPCGEVDDDDGEDNRMCNVRGVQPLVCRVNGTEGGGGGGVGLQEAMSLNRTGFAIGVYANCDPCIPGTILGVGLVLEQQFHVIAHVFYGYVPPEDWLFTETNTVPSPP